MGAFELFFTLLGSMALEEWFAPTNVINTLFQNAVFNSDDEAREVINEIMNFSNDISFTLMKFEEGNFKNRDIQTLSKNLCKIVLDKLTHESLRERYVPSIVAPLYNSFEAKGYDVDDFKNLIHSIHAEYKEFEGLSEDIAGVISMLSLCNTKEFTKILSEDGETLDGFLDYFVQHAIPTYATLDLLRKLEYLEEQNFEKAKRNDPCPCGSGKKYKKRPKRDSIFQLMENGTYFCDLDLMESGEISDIRDYFASHPKIIDEYLTKEQNFLSELELKTIKNFKNILYDQFIIMERINNSEVLAWNVQNKKIYLVYGLYDPIAEVVQELPCIASLILLEYEERIVFDGLMGVNRVEIGNNMLLDMIEEYRSIRDADGVVLRLGE
ncbi:hypothetical protein FCU45_08865 [Sulfurimonas crateris]|uniref:Uncharacterized protein n=1 Tax=Sulfurimonas crateris TaxID=2574727 RepID=A0A4U2Z6F1_9BACT|nr:SEC-C metal-binding domain-containing protein [Sulfurimonas crateris]TKI69062.1 hypothetical protein FCU45_08865 [Sulfurimonas crateris]